jgi:hypothetical protein
MYTGEACAQMILIWNCKVPLALANISHNDDRLLYNMANAPITYRGFKVPSVEHLGRLRDKLWQATRTSLRPGFEANTYVTIICQRLLPKNHK